MNPIASRLASQIFDQPLIQNQYRSAFIEAMIAQYLAPSNWRFSGDGWSGWDFERNDGARLEVKQSAARQTWSEERQFQTRGVFDIASRAGYYENGTKFIAKRGRPAQIYVFAWNPVFGPDEEYPHEPETDHRNPDQWQFYIVLARLLPENQKTIALSKVQALAAPCKIDELHENVERLLSLAPTTASSDGQPGLGGESRPSDENV